MNSSLRALSNLDMQIDHSSDLFWASSIILSLIKVLQLKKHIPWLMSVRKKPYRFYLLERKKPKTLQVQNNYTLSLFSASFHIFISWIQSFLGAGQEPHWSQSHRWLCFVQSPLAQSVPRSMGDLSSLQCLCLATSHNTLPQWLIMCLNGNTECKLVHDVTRRANSSSSHNGPAERTSWYHYILRHGWPKTYT